VKIIADLGGYKHDSLHQKMNNNIVYETDDYKRDKIDFVKRFTVLYLLFRLRQIGELILNRSQFSKN